MTTPDTDTQSPTVRPGSMTANGDRGQRDGWADADGAGEYPPLSGQRAIEAAKAINEDILDIQHTSHIVTLEAVTILDLADKQPPIKTGCVLTVANRICDRPRTRRIVGNSLEQLEDRGFITREPSTEVDAFDCRPTEKGYSFFRHVGSLGFLKNLAETEVVEDV